MKLLLSVMATLLIMTSQVYAEDRFVQRVEDANTLVLLNGERVKLIGLDTPNQKSDPEAHLETANFIRGLISGTVVKLEYDFEKVDKEGNILAYVWVRFDEMSFLESLDLPENYIVQYKGYESGEGSFYVFVNATVIKSGFADPVEKTPNLKYAKLFANLYNQRQVKTAAVYTDSPDTTKIATTNFVPKN